MIIEPPARPLPPYRNPQPDLVVDAFGSVCRRGDAVGAYEYGDNRSQVDGAMEGRR